MMASMENIKVGDVVQLKSGGPLMTVAKLRPAEDEVKCYYFHNVPGSILQVDNFPLEVLKVVQ